MSLRKKSKSSQNIMHFQIKLRNYRVFFFFFCNIQLNSIWNSNCKGHAIKARTWAEEIFEVLFYLKCKYIKGRIQASVSANWNGLVRWCWYWMVKYYLWWYQKISVGISSNIEHTIFKHERKNIPYSIFEYRIFKKIIWKSLKDRNRVGFRGNTIKFRGNTR